MDHFAFSGSFGGILKAIDVSQVRHVVCNYVDIAGDLG